MSKFIRNEQIEIRTMELIKNYERKTKSTISFPVPIEKILIQEFDLFIEWDDIDEEHGIQVLGGLSPEKKIIVLNLKHKNLYSEVIGLERSTIGHEAGHWEYDVDKSNIGNELTLGFISQKPYYNRTSKNYGNISSYRGNIKTKVTREMVDKLKKYDSPDQARIVNRFSASLNMPEYLINEYLRDNKLNDFSDFYKMRDLLDVSSSALKVRLEQLNFMYIVDGKFYSKKQSAFGQESLNF